MAFKKIAPNHFISSFFQSTFEIQIQKFKILELLRNMSSSSVQPLVKGIGEEDKNQDEIKQETVVVDKFNSSPNPNPNITKDLPPFKRIKKHKMGLMLSYCGKSYFGMQMNKNGEVVTIEEKLIDALYKAEFIEEEVYKRPQEANFQRAARTDKGVSAARQIISMKLPYEIIDAEKINEHLPIEIRVQGMKKVTRGFCAKNLCDSRTYSYMLPSFAFTPLEERVTEDYRISPEVLEKVRETLKIYLGGSKKYHNFTSGKKPNDPSSYRTMREFTCSEPFIKEGLEFLILRVRGQSFMLHQIRKMVGLVIALLRGYASMETVENTWKEKRIDIPKAPGLGLMLEHVHYDIYNERYGNDGIHQPLTWEKEEEKVQKFCEQFIFPVVVQTEKEEKSMLKWMGTLLLHSYSDVEYRDNTSSEVLTPLAKAELQIKRERGEKIYTDIDNNDEGGDDNDEIKSQKIRKVDT